MTQGPTPEPPERWRQIEALFDTVVDLPTHERDATLLAACGDDATLRAEVESLVEATRGAAQQLEQVIAAELRHMAPPPLRGRTLGPYRLLEELGEGGMGVVWLAERDDGQYRTRVAIKLLRGHGSDEAIARFRDERQILAGLEHPGIVRLLDGGSEQGEPYLVMEYVDGVPITRYAAQHELSLHARLELFGKVAAAVAFAHQRLIVHRDLKPSNILVTKHGAPKLLDFGIAKLLDAGAVREAETRTGRQLLTPEYASPEQLRGEPITTATDIYSLGVVLYELCTDAKAQPIDTEHLAVALRTILEQEPRRPSVVAPASRRRALRGDLDNIILKALHKQPDRRYASVEQLVEDLERHLAGLPVRARPATLGYRAGKFLRRNAVAVGASVLVLGLLSAATLISIDQARRADEQARAAQHAREQADQQAALAREQAEHARAQARSARDAMRVGAAQRAMQVDDPTAAILLLREVESAAPEHAFGWLAAVPHFTRASFVSTRRFEGGEQAVAAKWSPDGAHLLVSWLDAPPQLWSADGKLLRTLGDEQLRAQNLAWSPDGTHMATVSGDGLGRVWQLDGTLLSTLDGHDPIAGTGIVVSWSGDGSRIATAADDHFVIIWDPQGSMQARFEAHPSAVTELVWSDDGRRLATASRWDPRVRVWQRDGALLSVLDGHQGGVHALAWVDDERLLSGGDDAVARIWNVATRTSIALAAHERPIIAVDVDPSGARVALASMDERASIWRVDSTLAHGATPERVFAGESRTLADVRWSSDGSLLAVASHDPRVRVWKPDGTLLGSISQREGDPRVAWRPRAPTQLLTLARGSATVELWAPEQNLPTQLRAHTQAVRAGAWSRDGHLLATASDDATLRVWTRSGSARALLAGHQHAIHQVAWRDDGTLISADAHELRSWRASPSGDAWTEHLRFGPSEEELLSFAWAGELATAHADGSVRLWRPDGQLRTTLHAHDDAVRSLAWSREGLLATASWDTTARIWKHDQPIVTLTGHTRPVQALAWSGDGTRLATAAMDRSTRIWDTAGTQLGELSGTDVMDLLAWSPDGARIVTTGNSQARIWSAAGEPLARLLGHTGEIVSISWSGDGSRLLTASFDGSARLWNAEGLLLATFAHENPLTKAVFAPDDDAVLTTDTEGLAMIWVIDANALLRGFWLSTPRCLGVEARQRLLAEPREASERGQTRCEAMQACLAAGGVGHFERCHAEFREARD